MSNRKLLLFTFVICNSLIQFTSAQQTTKTEIDWEDKLYEKDAKYEDFACRDEDKKTVSEFFEKHRLVRVLRVCHNNCAVLDSFSFRPLPPFGENIIGKGSVAVHVLADESGRPIYARAVNGHRLLQTLLEKRTCESKFKPDSQKRQNVLLLCPTENCTGMQPVEQDSK